jgi:hypothetical protein
LADDRFVFASWLTVSQDIVAEKSRSLKLPET